MELCDGGNIQEQRPDDRHRHIDQAIQAIGECHANGIIHKDIKADNFLLSANQVKLIDFGISEYDFGLVTVHPFLTVCLCYHL
jgi:serine/threonine protein kinase